jgi:PAS domain S-box-containing protein
MTSIADEALAVQAVQLGAQDYLVKGQVDGGLLRRALLYAVERKKAEETLRQQASLLDISYDAIFSWEIGGGILSWNRGAEELYGFSAAEAVGQEPHDLLKTASFDVQQLERKLQSDGRWEGELTHTTRSGRKTIVESRMVTLKQPGQPGIVLESNRGITDRKRAEEEIRLLNESLRQRAAELEASNKELEAFNYSVSHDLRAPLLAISGFSHIVLKKYAGQLDAEGSRLMGLVVSNTKKMEHLIDGILAFSRAGRQELKTAPTEMTRLVQSVVTELREIEPDRRISVRIDPLENAWGDQALLRQVWTNLLSNAFKFTRTNPDAEACVECQIDNCEIVYHVQDNGVGFEMAYVDKLFGVFQRLHGAEHPGTGIGLAIVKQIVTRHGGRVWAEGELGKGACFSFTLPRRDIPGKE